MGADGRQQFPESLAGIKDSILQVLEQSMGKDKQMHQESSLYQQENHWKSYVWKGGENKNTLEDEFKNIDWACRKSIRKAKAELELSQWMSKAINRPFITTLIVKGWKRQTWAYRIVDLVTVGTDEAEAFNVIFASVFIDYVSQASVPSERDLPAVDGGWVRVYLQEFDPYKTMGTNGLHPRIRSELANIFAIFIIFEWLWRY